MFNSIKILKHQGRQYIKDLAAVELKPPFRGRPKIAICDTGADELASVCPVGAIGTKPVTIDMGKCVFCGECALRYPEKVSFTQDYYLASNSRDALIVREGTNEPVEFDKSAIRKEIQGIFGKSLKLRQVSAAGDNSAELELNATRNVNFDLGRFGIEFVASPRHADGIVVTGPISANMAEALQICYDATPSPKIIILCGADAISGGIFADSPAIDRSFLYSHKVDLYIPGNPPHPLTIIHGILKLVRTA
jgi:Ni,Fe-hydrogenase III small subunit